MVQRNKPASPVKRFQGSAILFQEPCPLQDVEHAFLKFLNAQTDGGLAYDQNEIELFGDLARLVANDLFHKPSHPIAHDGIADFLAGRDAEPERFRFMLAGPVHDELAVGERFAVSVDPAEIFAITQTQLFLHGASSPNL